jgi:DNA-binding MarR family transcriptional regulator
MVKVSLNDATRVGLALRRFSLANNLLRTTMAERLPINVSELIVMIQLAESDHQTPTQLARMLNVTTASVTVQVDHLDAAGFVYRTPSTSDRRSFVLSLTPAGTLLMQQLEEQFRTAITEAFQHSEPPFAPQIASFLERVSQTLVDLAHTDPEQGPHPTNQQPMR